MVDSEIAGTPCLMVVLDLHPYYWFSRVPAPTEEGSRSSTGPMQLSEFLSVLVTFLNAYRLMNRATQIRIIGSHLSGANLLFDSTRESGNLAKELSRNLKKLLKSSPGSDEARTEETGSKLGAALSLSICICNKLIREEILPRILVFSVAPDLSHQYVAVMNCIFSAQKLRILIDSCVLFAEDSPLLQQASYITGGVYLRPRDQRESLTQCLLSAYLADSETRQYLKVPMVKSVDFQASCFCHKQSKNIAYVCSVCLSIFCSFVPICPTCNVRFPFELPLDS
jgi:transcription initiation factor TFIIH subunit 3